jgi:DNA polymerase-3 subunit epsilon
MNYLDKLVSLLQKQPLTKTQFNNLLKKSDTFFDSIELETQLLLSNGLPLLIDDKYVTLLTTITKIQDQTFCIVDIETSHPTPQQGQLIEIGAIKYKNGQIIETYNSLVNTKQIPHKVQQITGITPEMTHKAPNIEEVLEEFKIFLEDSVFVAHNISFDYKFVSNSFQKYDLGKLYNRRLCTIDLAKRTIKAPRYGLKYLSEQFSLNIQSHHRAFDDALCTQKILELSLKNLPKDIVTTEELIKFSRQ